MRKLFVLVGVLGVICWGGVAEANDQPREEDTRSDQLSPAAQGENDIENTVEGRTATEAGEGVSATEGASPESFDTTVIHEKPRTRFPVGPVILGSFGVVMVAVGAGFGWQADQDYDKYNTFRDNHYPNATEDLKSDIETYSTVANALMFSGLGVIVASVIWGVTEGVVRKKQREKKERERQSATWRPLIGPTQAGVTVAF